MAKQGVTKEKGPQEPKEAKSKEQEPGEEKETEEKSPELKKSEKREAAGTVSKMLDGDGKVAVDCRNCVNYPLRSVPPTTDIVEDIRIVTNKWKKTYCGKRPVHEDGVLKDKVVNPKLDCRDKKFKPV